MDSVPFVKLCLGDKFLRTKKDLGRDRFMSSINNLLPLKNDEFDVYRKEYNNLIKKKSKELKYQHTKTEKQMDKIMESLFNTSIN